MKKILCGNNFTRLKYNYNQYFALKIFFVSTESIKNKWNLGLNIFSNKIGDLFE